MSAPHVAPQAGRTRNLRMTRLDTDLLARCADEAEARGVSITWFVNRLLAEGLDRLKPADQWRLTREVG